MSAGHRPGRPEDLPHPELLWAAGTARVVCADLVGGLDANTVGHRGVRVDDGGGNWWRLALVEGGPAVLYGEDSEASKGKWHTPPVDFLRGGPDWLPWDTLLDLESGCELGFVYWWEEHLGWARAPYPEDLKDDGLATTALLSADLDRVLDDLTGTLCDSAWPDDTQGGGEGDDEEALAAHFRTIAETVVRHVRSRTLTGPLLTESVGTRLGDALEVSAAVETARRAGAVPGAPRPLTPRGSGRPGV
ncbi:hypothetical protein ABVG11_25930 [Streptomyces sp. HD1123-B1]|uniref:hypothetical protein n=1 Tax=Streptomyces huangiella TaxID=3228804 RepID=UPI003D7CD3CB